MKKKTLKLEEDDEFNMEQMKYFISLSLKDKLNHLEQLNQFCNKLMPESSKQNWEKLQNEGF